MAFGFQCGDRAGKFQNNLTGHTKQPPSEQQPCHQKRPDQRQIGRDDGRVKQGRDQVTAAEAAAAFFIGDPFFGGFCQCVAAQMQQAVAYRGGGCDLHRHRAEAGFQPRTMLREGFGIRGRDQGQPADLAPWQNHVAQAEIRAQGIDQAGIGWALGAVQLSCRPMALHGGVKIGAADEALREEDIRQAAMALALQHQGFKQLRLADQPVAQQGRGEGGRAIRCQCLRRRQRIGEPQIGLGPLQRRRRREFEGFG